MSARATVGVRSLELVLPGFVPDSRLSLNGRHRTHWTTTRLLRVEAALQVEWAIIAHGPPGLFPGRSRVDITFVYPTRRRRDPDGLAGLAKPLLDALVACLVLPDDDSEHVELAVRAIVEKGVTETRIRIEELDTATRQEP